LNLDAYAVRIGISTVETDDGRLIEHDPKSQAGRRKAGHRRVSASSLEERLLVCGLG
jgi:hypothetical protein